MKAIQVSLRAVLGIDDEIDDNPAPLSNVNAAVFKKKQTKMFIQWHTHHKDNPHHPEDNENKEK